MKEFIIFLAFLILLMSLTVYITDSNNYIRLQKYLKAMADEAASGAILMGAFEQSGSGCYVIDETAASSYAGFTCDTFTQSISPMNYGSISVASVSSESFPTGAAVTVTVKWSPGNLSNGKKYSLFRMFTDKYEEVVRSSTYEAVIKGE